MKKLFFSTILIAFSMTTYADVFDELDKETAQIEQYCLDGQGRVSEEIVTSRNKTTGKIISEKIVTIIFCTDGSRHVAKKANNTNNLSIETTKILDGVNHKSTAKGYKCTFENSFLIGICNGNQYYYSEQLSSVKRKDLTAFYRFVKKSGGDTNTISDTCVDIKNKNRKLIKCNDLGITLETE